MASLTISPLSDDDVPGLIALWQRCQMTVPYNDPASDIAMARDQDSSQILVGRLETRPVASVMVGHDGHRGWLYYVAVDPLYQRNGYGERMVAAAETWLRDHGVAKVMLLIRDTNTAVRGFYEKLGYEGIPRVVMQRWL